MCSASGLTRESVICLLVVAVACAKTEPNATPAAKEVPKVAATAVVLLHPSVCALLPKSDMESLLHVTLATMEDETEPDGRSSTCQYFVDPDQPMQRVEVKVDWYADLDRARAVMSVSDAAHSQVAGAATPADFETIPGLGDDALSYVAGTLTVRKGLVVIGILSRLAEPEGDPLHPAFNPAVEREKTIARAVLAKL